MDHSSDHSPQDQKSPENLGNCQRELLSRDQIETEYGISRRWLELAALKGDGPPMIKISRRMVRYQRNALDAWLVERTVSSTSDASGSE